MPGVPVCPLPKGLKEPGSVGDSIITEIVAAACCHMGDVRELDPEGGFARCEIGEGRRLIVSYLLSKEPTTRK